MSELEKKTRKANPVYSLGISILFVILGIYIFTTKSQTVDIEYSTLVKILGLASIIFFGIIAILSIRKLIK